LPSEGRAAFNRAIAEQQSLVREIEDGERVATAPPWMPASLGVSSVVDYAYCPKRFYWSVVRPLPRFSGPAARIGTDIHRWIERRSSGQASLIELEDEPDLTAEELAGEPGRMERLRKAFLDSRFAGEVPLFTERPFLLHLDGFVVSGRIDAVYGAADGPWEVVDYKTGRRPSDDDPLVGLQLDLYALACVDVWHKRAEDIALTYLYLRSGEESSRPAGDVEETRRRVVEALREMSAGRFDATPGEHCRWCDFLSFCEPGKAFVKTLEARDPAT
jgi:DNA helicase-2/ATP-dependent DNA helicase PcrA